MTITLEEDGNTLLTCPVIDQAALHGLLKRVRDLGIPLLSVNFVRPGQAKTQEDKSVNHINFNFHINQSNNFKKGDEYNK